MANLNFDALTELLTSDQTYSLLPPIETRTLATGTNNNTIAIHSSSGDFVWRGYQTHARPETILYEHRLLSWLAEQPLSFRVPAPVRMKNGDTLYQDDQGYYALFPLVAGEVPDRANNAQMKSVGAALGELHRQLEIYPETTRPGLSTYGTVTDVHPRLPAPAAMQPQDVGLTGTEPEALLFAWWREEIAQIQQWQEDHYASLPHQVIHGDFTPGNTLVVGDQVSALLDFDFALLDARAVDVAAGLYFTMRIWENPDPWPVVSAFCYGYQQQNTLTKAEILAIPWLMRLRCAVSIVWWFGKEAAAGKSVGLWRLEDLRNLVGWLDNNEARLMTLWA